MLEIGVPELLMKRAVRHALDTILPESSGGLALLVKWLIKLRIIIVFARYLEGSQTSFGTLGGFRRGNLAISK